MRSRNLNLLDLPMRKTQTESAEVTKVTKPLQGEISARCAWRGWVGVEPQALLIRVTCRFLKQARNYKTPREIQIASTK